jgi:hypothetical protein
MRKKKENDRNSLKKEIIKKRKKAKTKVSTQKK